MFSHQGLPLDSETLEYGWLVEAIIGDITGKLTSPQVNYQNLTCLSLCIWETPKWVLLQTVETQMKSHLMQHFIRVYTLFVKVKKIFRQNNSICFFLNYNLMPLDMYNGLSQFYCIKLEGRTH